MLVPGITEYSTEDIHQASILLSVFSGIVFVIIWKFYSTPIKISMLECFY